MKGISPLIAAVLLIAITVAIATLVTGWVSSLTRSTQVSVENKTTEAVDCASASITIDNVFVDTNGSHPWRNVFIVVRNSGQIDDMQITNVTLFNSSGGEFSFGTTQPVLINFDRGSSYSFRVTNTTAANPVGTVCPTHFSKAIATTSCGGVFAVFDKTPRCG